MHHEAKGDAGRMAGWRAETKSSFGRGGTPGIGPAGGGGA